MENTEFRRMLVLIFKYLEVYAEDLDACKVESKDCKALSFKEIELKQASFAI